MQRVVRRPALAVVSGLMYKSACPKAAVLVKFATLNPPQVCHLTSKERAKTTRQGAANNRGPIMADAACVVVLAPQVRLVLDIGLAGERRAAVLEAAKAGLHSVL